MASLTKYDRSPFWFAVYRDAAGCQRSKSTKIAYGPHADTPKARSALAAKNKRVAMDIALRLEEAERGNATEAHLRKVLAEISVRVNSQKLEFAVTRKFLNDWAERAARTKSPATAVRYKGTIDKFLENLGSKAEATLGDITAQDIQKFVSWRLGGGRNATTIMVDLKTLNAPFALAMRQGLILTNPVPAADAPKAEKESREPFTWEQVGLLLKATEALAKEKPQEAAVWKEWKTAVMLGAFTGQRLGDCVSITWDSVDLDKHLLRFRPQKTRHQKRDLVLPLHPDLEKRLMDLPEQKGQPLCPSLSTAKIGGRSGLSRKFQEIMKKAGIEGQTIEAGGDEGRTFNKLSFHSLRHT